MVPRRGEKSLREATEAQLPPGVDYDLHFKPRYNPWEQKLCAWVDGDFFAALRSGKVDVVTGDGVVMQSGEVVRPDVIVRATGLKLLFGGGIAFSVEGEGAEWNQRFAWRAAMVEGVPNLAFLVGYEAWSCTLGADVSTRLFVRV